MGAVKLTKYHTEVNVNKYRYHMEVKPTKKYHMEAPRQQNTDFTLGEPDDTKKDKDDN